LEPEPVLFRFWLMPSHARHQLVGPPELTGEEVRRLAYRAIAECSEAKAKTNELLTKSHDLLTRVDELLARRPL
jgi:hypothetical protein